MIHGNFYNVSEPPNAINKTIENATVLDGKYYETFDELRPRLQLRWNNTPFTFNYCIIDGTAYFIENVSRETNNVLTLNLLLDVLQTYKTELLAAVGTVVSRENANPFISNRDTVHDMRPRFERVDFSVENPFDENGVIIMVTLKGN